MKKLLAALFAFVLFACSSKAETLDGDYVLQNAPEGAEITLSLANGHYSGKSGVNNYFGSYETDGEKIRFERGGLTMMMGPENLMQAEQDYLNTLFEVESYHLLGKTLVLDVSNASSLTFEKK